MSRLESVHTTEAPYFDPNAVQRLYRRIGKLRPDYPFADINEHAFDDEFGPAAQQVLGFIALFAANIQRPQSEEKKRTILQLIAFLEHGPYKNISASSQLKRPRLPYQTQGAVTVALINTAATVISRGIKSL